MGGEPLESNYGYLNARIKGMKCRFFRREDLEKMLRTENEDALIRILETSDYGVDMTESLTKFSGFRAIEEALSRNLVRSCQRIRSLANGQPQELVEILLGRWDLYNIKTILRGIFSESEPERILEDVVPAGTLDLPALQELAQASDIKALADILATWGLEYAQLLANSLKQPLRQEDHARLEYNLDSFYIQDSLERLKGPDANHRQVQDVIEAEIDSTNVMMTLRSVSEGIGEEHGQQLLLKHGSLKEEFLLSLLKCEKPVDILEKLERTQFAYAVEKGILLFGETGNVSVIEKFIEEILIRKCIRIFYRGDPLSISVAIGYIWMKYNEFMNLRLIARGLRFGMPVNAIHEELVFV